MTILTKTFTKGTHLGPLKSKNVRNLVREFRCKDKSISNIYFKTPHLTEFFKISTNREYQILIHCVISYNK